MIFTKNKINLGSLEALSLLERNLPRPSRSSGRWYWDETYLFFLFNWGGNPNSSGKERGLFIIVIDI